MIDIAFRLKEYRHQSYGEESSCLTSSLPKELEVMSTTVCRMGDTVRGDSNPCILNLNDVLGIDWASDTRNGGYDS